MKIADNKIIFDNGYTISTKFINDKNALRTIKAVYNYCIKNKGNKNNVTVKDMIEYYEPGSYNEFTHHEKLLAGAIISQMFCDGKISGLERNIKKRGNTWLYYC